MKSVFSTEPLRLKIAGDASGVVGTWLHVPSATSAEFMATVGCDFLVVDVQHSVTDFGCAADMIRTLTLKKVPVLVRTTGLDPMQAGRVLDAGASGVICPMINNVSEAEALVRACRYPPKGARSLGPFRPRLLWGETYRNDATDGVIVIAMIETPDGLHNMNEIAQVDGLDGLFAGPNDVALAIGEEPALDPENPKVCAALKNIASAATRHGKFAGIACDYPDFATSAAEWGYRFHIIASDVKFMERGASNMIEAMKRNI